MRVVAAFHEPRDDRVQRPLARSERVRVRLVEREQCAAVVQREAGAGRDDRGAEPFVDALDQRDDVAVAVDDGEVDRVVARRIGQAVKGGRAHVVRRTAGTNLRCAPLRMWLVEHRRDRRLREARVADVAQHVRVGELLRLDHHVQRAGAVEAVLAQRKLLHQVEHHQRRDPLRVRRQLVDRPAAIGRRDRLDPFGRELLEIAGGHRAALLVRNRQDGVGCGSLVEACSAVRGDAAQRCREVGVAEELAAARRAAVGQVGRRSASVRPPACRPAPPSARR